MKMMIKGVDNIFWEVLSWVYFDIRNKAYFAPNKTIVYTEPNRSSSFNPAPLGEAKSAIYYLQDKEAIQVIDEEDLGERSGVPIRWKLKILQPKFNKFADELLDSDNPNHIIDKTVLAWDVISLNIKTGRAKIKDKSHLFKIQKPPFKILKLLLEKRIYEQGDGEANYTELTKVTGINNKETLKSKVRELRRQFDMNQKKNPLEDIFQQTGNGYRIIQQEPFK